MLRTYSGEYFVSPAPLHLGLNACSNRCWYCFANLNKPNRVGDYASVGRAVKRLAEGRAPTTPMDWFLSRRYPVLASNTADPFARSNRDHFLQCHDLLRSFGVPMTYQTRGGGNSMEHLMAEPPTMVYISITSDNNDLLRRNEPGAPCFEERVELARACRDHGHHVVIGLNPYVPFWWNDAYGFIDRLKAMDLRHVWTGHLHLTSEQVGSMTATCRSNHALEIDYATKRNKPDQESLIDPFLQYATDRGVNVFSYSTSMLGNFWEPYFKLFPDHWMPTLEGLLDALFDKGGGSPVAFTFDWFDSWANVAPELRSSAFKEYLNSFGRSVRNHGEKANADSFRMVHDFYWRIVDFHTPLDCDDFCIAVGEEDGEERTADEGGKDVLIYDYGNEDFDARLTDCVKYLFGPGDEVTAGEKSIP